MGSQREITLEELSKHNKESDAWLAINGKVYDVTDYIRVHPGGKASIMQGVGKDATTMFKQAHSYINPDAVLKAKQVGTLKKCFRVCLPCPRVVLQGPHHQRTVLITAIPPLTVQPPLAPIAANFPINIISPGYTNNVSALPGSSGTQSTPPSSPRGMIVQSCPTPTVRYIICPGRPGILAGNIYANDQQSIITGNDARARQEEDIREKSDEEETLENSTPMYDSTVMSVKRSDSQSES